MPGNQHLPPEWATQAGILLAWPHEKTDWAPSLEPIQATYAEMAREITTRQPLLIVCNDDRHLAQVRRQLRLADIDLGSVHFALAPFGDTWVRDYGPLTVLFRGVPKMLDFRFNAWGGKYPASLDNAVTRALHDASIFGDTALESIPLVLEGGSIEVDGAGGLLTTCACLMSSTRNPGLDKPVLEAKLSALMGAERVSWLEHGFLVGDDTDSHIDMLARFCDANTIAYTACEDPGDDHYQSLKVMEAELRDFRTHAGAPYDLIPLPLPQPIRDHEGRRLPASYANFLIINGAVLLPAYRDSMDEVACHRLADVFPDREIVPVDCTALIHQYGSLHCATMQLPQGVTINDASRTSSTRQRR
jgi:agmatine/peptidylarginine deiminase